MKKLLFSMTLFCFWTAFLVAGTASAALYNYEGELIIRDQDLDLNTAHFLDGYELRSFSGQFEVEDDILSLFTFSINNGTTTYDFSYGDDVPLGSYPMGSYNYSGYKMAVDDNAAFMLRLSGSSYALSIYDESDDGPSHWATLWGSSRTLDNFRYEVVPVPAAAWLLGSGLLGLAGLRRRMKS